MTEQTDAEFLESAATYFDAFNPMGRAGSDADRLRAIATKLRVMETEIERREASCRNYLEAHAKRTAAYWENHEDGDRA